MSTLSTPAPCRAMTLRRGQASRISLRHLEAARDHRVGLRQRRLSVAGEFLAAHDAEARLERFEHVRMHGVGNDDQRPIHSSSLLPRSRISSIVARVTPSASAERIMSFQPSTASGIPLARRSLRWRRSGSPGTMTLRHAGLRLARAHEVDVAGDHLGEIPPAVEHLRIDVDRQHAVPRLRSVACGARAGDDAGQQFAGEREARSLVIAHGDQRTGPAARIRRLAFRHLP